MAALASDGTLIHGSNRVTPTGTRLSVGSVASTAFIARGPYLFAILGGTVYRITPWMPMRESPSPLSRGRYVIVTPA